MNLTLMDVVGASRRRGLGGLGDPDYSALAIQIASCVVAAAGGTFPGRCVLDALMSAASVSDTETVILTTIKNTSCDSFLTYLGMNSTAASILSAALSPYWSRLQAWANNQLAVPTSVTSRTPITEGGVHGQLVTWSNGWQVKECSAPIYDASGTLLGYSVSMIPATDSCAQFAVPGATQIFSAKFRPMTHPNLVPASPAPGMSTGTKVAVGVGAVGVLALLAWWLL